MGIVDDVVFSFFPTELMCHNGSMYQIPFILVRASVCRYLGIYVQCFRPLCCFISGPSGRTLVNMGLTTGGELRTKTIRISSSPTDKLPKAHLVPGTLWNATATCKQNSTDSPRDMTYTSRPQGCHRQSAFVVAIPRSRYEQRYKRAGGA